MTLRPPRGILHEIVATVLLLVEKKIKAIFEVSESAFSSDV